MRIGSKTAIASIRNKGGVRVFIPEKLRIGGVQYIQPYTFLRMVSSTQPFIFSMKERAKIPVQIGMNEVILTAPFTMGLLRRYLRLVQGVESDLRQSAQKTRSAARYKILRNNSKGDWDEDFLGGKGKIVTG